MTIITREATQQLQIALGTEASGVLGAYDVTKLQQALGVTPDGVLGVNTLSAALLAAVAHSREETQWAVQERRTLNGPWERIDDGTTWSNRSRRPYTEAEARAEAAVAYNGFDPTLWRRVVKRTVGEWQPA